MLQKDNIDTLCQDNKKSTILHFAVQYERIEMVKEICLKAPKLINNYDKYQIYLTNYIILHYIMPHIKDLWIWLKFFVK